MLSIFAVHILPATGSRRERIPNGSKLVVIDRYGVSHEWQIKVLV